VPSLYPGLNARREDSRAYALLNMRHEEVPCMVCVFPIWVNELLSLSQSLSHTLFLEETWSSRISKDVASKVVTSGGSDGVVPLPNHEKLCAFFVKNLFWQTFDGGYPGSSTLWKTISLF
jgi:hypothetical protein